MAKIFGRMKRLGQLYDDRAQAKRNEPPEGGWKPWHLLFYSHRDGPVRYFVQRCDACDTAEMICTQERHAPLRTRRFHDTHQNCKK